MVRLTRRAQDLLEEILKHRDAKGNCDTDYWQEKFENLNGPEEAVLRSTFKELRVKDMVSVLWADNGPYILYVLAKGLAYFEEAEQEDDAHCASVVNNFYGNSSKIQIQQGTINSTQKMNNKENFDIDKIRELIECIKKYDLVLDQEYGKESADQLREAIEKLNATLEKGQNTGKIKSLLNTIKELSVNAGGGLIASGVIQLIKTIMGQLG